MEIIKGSSFALVGTIYTYWSGDTSTSELATPAQMTGAIVKLLVKQRENDSDANALLNIAGIVTDVNEATVKVSVSAANTNDMSYQNLVCEIVVKLSDGTYQRTGSQPLNLKTNLSKTLF